ncbi:unnamed protein product [Ambrosiozyma monospora]|uniref:Unnamed protein product n=1 Tax=Ambrosiozyma monospora TaxID=43982 RepID=A0ACB5T7S9_AMBMO|nr:unnamed protein product [Ambrosiozyma monospora]
MVATLNDHHQSNIRNNVLSKPNSTSPSDNIEQAIVMNKRKIQEMLINVYGPDESMLLGTLNFAHSKFTNYVLDDFNHEMSKVESNYEFEDGSEENQDDIESNENDPEALHLAQSNRLSPGTLVDRVWIEIHHPSIKHFQNMFHQLSKSTGRTKRPNSHNHYNSGNGSNNKYNSMKSVEMRKLFDKFARFISRCYEFYYQLLKQVVTTYDLCKYIPVKKLSTTLKLDMDPHAPGASKIFVPATGPIGNMVYVVHKCVLYIGDLSRYRALVAKTYLPSTSISKEDNNNYSKSIELYKLSLLILPSLGDPYNHIAIIDNLKDDKFNVVYNFIRSTLTQKQLPVGFNNLLNFLCKNPASNVMLKKFESFNELDRLTITKNDRLELLKSQFLVLFAFHLLPDQWKLREGYLVKGHKVAEIEDDITS